MMSLSTNRLTMRKLGEGDIRDLFALDGDREVRRYIDDGKAPEPWDVYEVNARRKIEGFAKYGPELGFGRRDWRMIRLWGGFICVRMARFFRGRRKSAIDCGASFGARAWRRRERGGCSMRHFAIWA